MIVLKWIRMAIYNTLVLLEQAAFEGDSDAVKKYGEELTRQTQALALAQESEE